MATESCLSSSQISKVDNEKLVRPKVQLKSLLEDAGADKDVFTMKEVLFYLGKYIMNKELYDKQQQHIVHCGEDALGAVLGVKSFSVKEPRALFALINRNLVTVKNTDIQYTFSEPSSQSEPDRGPLHTDSDSHSSTSQQQRRRRRSSDPDIQYTFSEPSSQSDPDRGPGDMDSDSRSSTSQQQRRRRRSSDPEYFRVLQPEDDPRECKKRHKSDSFSLTFDDSLSWCVIGGLHRERGNSESSEAQSNSDVGISHSEGSEESEDSEAESDNFSVEFEVESINSDAYSEHDEDSLPGENEEYEVTTFAEDEDSFDEDTEITEAVCGSSQEETPELERYKSLEACLPATCLEPCVICQSRPKNGCIIHGRTGHLMACYTCAKKLKNRNKLCPVCREPIQSVVLTYMS